jgi:uncharacterized protein YraI
VEVHVGGYDGKASYTDVWYSGDIPSDEKYAKAMSAEISKLLKVPDCGSRARNSDTNRDANTNSFEDYYALLDDAKANMISHVFLAECGFIDYPDTEEKLKYDKTLDSIADVITKTICNIFDIDYDFKLIEPQPEKLYLTVDKGTYFVRADAGTQYKAITAVTGVTKLEVLAVKDGWYKINIKGMTGYIRPNVGSTVGRSSQTVYPPRETVKKGSFYVRSGPGEDYDAIGVIKGSESWNVLNENGWRLLPYGGRIGYAPKEAFE